MICITCGTQFSPPGKCPECDWDTDLTHDASALASPGEVLAARYSIQKYLGSGRLGVCFKATDYKLNADVVIKFIHPAFLPTPPHFKRFTAGMDELRKNRHPLSAALLDVGQLNGHVYASYEYTEGGSLAELLNFRLKSHQTFTLGEIYPVLKEAAACLIESPVAVHGTLCPKNIFIQSGSIKVLDCGLLANLPEAVVGYRLTSTSKRRRYVAPEILAGDGPSTRSDVYSLGVILGEMLTLKRYNGDPTLFHEQIREIAPDLEDVLHSALAANKKDRFKDAEVFLNALADISALPPPHFQRVWMADDDSIIEDISHVQEDKTAQIVMKDVIQQHYEEVTSVGRNPLLGAKSSAPPLPKPSSTEPPQHQPDVERLPVPHAKSSLPKPGAGGLPRSASTPGISLPKPSVAPAPPRPSIADFGSAPFDTDYENGDGAQNDLDEPSEVFELEDYELSPPTLDDDDEIQSVEMDDLQLEELSSVTPLSKFDDSSSGSNPLVKETTELPDVNPRFLRAAMKLDSSRQESAATSASERERDLDDINPRFLRAAKKLANAPDEVMPAARDSALFDDGDDWRARISQETSSNEDSVVSFLAPPSERKSPSAPTPPVVAQSPRATAAEPQFKISAPPPPPPPPRAKKP